MGGAGLLPARPAASCGGTNDRARARRRDARRSGGGPGLAGCRPLHRRSNPFLCDGSAGADRRGEQPALLARLLAVREDIKVASTRERLWQAAARLVPAENAGDFNQALMDLGALVCTPREPAAWFVRCRGSARRGSSAFKTGCPRRRPRPLRSWSRKPRWFWCAAGES